jgi:AAA+ superfamily predicted ATPase
MKSKIFVIMYALASFQQALSSQGIMQTAKQMAIDTIKSTSQAIMSKCTIENCTLENATKLALAAAVTYAGYKVKQKLYPDKGIRAVTWKNVKENWIGSFPQAFETLLNSTKSYATFEQKGLPIPNAYLFYGKSNTGKTTLVRVLSEKLDVPLIEIKGERFFLSSKKQTEEYFKDMLKVAHTCKVKVPFKCIICIDNLENAWTGNNEIEHIIKSLAEAISDKGNRDILFIVSTKDKEKVKYKKLTLVELTPPNEETRKALIIQTLKKSDVELDEKAMTTLLQETAEFSVAQLTEILENVATARLLDKESDVLTIITNVFAKQKEQPDIPKDAAKNWYGSLPEKFEQLLKSKKHYKALTEKGLNLPNGYLLHGAPGAGKTFAVQVLAEKLQIPLIEINSGQILTKYQGGGNEKLKEILEKAHGYNPQAPFKCIIFIDELDGLQRNRPNSPGDEDRLVNDLLATITNKENKDILFIGATNFLDKIDEALQRDGRLIPVKVELPTDTTREKVIAGLLEKYTVTLDARLLDMDELLKKTKGFSSATIDALITDALRMHIIDEQGIKPSFTQHLKTLLEKKRQDNQRKQKEIPQQKEQVAKEEEKEEEDPIPDSLLHTMYS